MKPGEIGKKLGIGVRIAGRIAQQRVEGHARSNQGQAARNQAHPSETSGGSVAGQGFNVAELRDHVVEYQGQVEELRKKGHKVSRAAGRGMGGFLRPFTRVGGILLLEVTGVFFGLIASYFGQDAWKVRADYAQGPAHGHFLMAAVAAGLFVYLCVSSFWRARRK